MSIRSLMLLICSFFYAHDGLCAEYSAKIADSSRPDIDLVWVDNTHVAYIARQSDGKGFASSVQLWDIEKNTIVSAFGEPPRGKPRGLTSGFARVQAALAPYLLVPVFRCNCVSQTHLIQP